MTRASPGRDTVDLAAVRDAAARIDGAVLRTPTVAAPALGAALGLEVALKLEILQRTGSFKERGALNKLLGLTRAQAKAGVIAASAGNHAQGLAYHARRLGIPATIVMPEATPFVKVERTAAFGARVLLIGADFSATEKAAAARATSDGLTVVHPYDDAAVIAGQGTIALEMLADAPALDTLVVPIGGGGLISGIALAAKALNPALAVIGVQVEGYAAVAAALRGTKPRFGGATLAEGIAVKRPGKLTMRLIERHVDDVMVVPEQRIEQAIELLLDSQNLVVEGAGAAGVAALIDRPGRFRGKRVGTVLCGANIDRRVLSSVLMRGMVRDHRLIRLRAEIGDSPGMLARLASVIGDAAGNIVEITHQRLFLDVPVKSAEVDVIVETRSRTHVGEIRAALARAGIPVRLMGAGLRD
ncbi:MAG TPA: threonine ammonia-lyase [Candidatus Sulfotelmatobacter sp.]|nr:threonine ammonia-lyase [Candidatus Sulfotelmatobacter sp.]